MHFLRAVAHHVPWQWSAGVSLVLCIGCGVVEPAASPAADALPFHHSVEVFRNYEGDVNVFVVRLEQKFLAGEFEKSNFLRLQPADDKAYLIYPKEARFEQKHAEFYGRLKGAGKTKLVLSYEMVSEDIKGQPKVETHQGEIELAIPTTAVGPANLLGDWARQQNAYFAELLRYYPDASFYQYVLLQSANRYGVSPPPLPEAVADEEGEAADLYGVFTGSLAVQEALQRNVLKRGAAVGDQTIHVSTLSPPTRRSLDFAELLEQKKEERGLEPSPHEIARLVPRDQYFIHFNSMKQLGEALDLTSQWGNNLLRMFTVRSQDNHLRQKLEDQLCVRRGPLTKLFADAVIGEVAATGADPFVLEGADVTLILRLKQPEIFEAAARGWVAEVKEKYPELAEEEFNYRGHRIAARYTTDRMVSSFSVKHGEYVAYSNSHRGIKKLIEAATGELPNLFDALDYRYVTTILPPSAAEDSGYFFASEDFVQQILGPAAKICEKRRVQCFNNLVMLNNASLMYRLEFGKAPRTLSDLAQGNFADLNKVVCPHGGAYAFDAVHDTCTCSLHNRLKYMTPNAELTVLNVSREEQSEYQAFKQAYEAFWRGSLDPAAVRITMGSSVKLETCVLPIAGGSLYQDLRGMVAKEPQPLSTVGIAPSAVFSVVAVPGREKLGDYIKLMPGVEEVLKSDPTLTDLKWLGDRASLHFCDDDLVVEIDPTRLRPLELPLVGSFSTGDQWAALAVLIAAKVPVYVAVDVNDRDKAQRLIDLLSEQIFLNRGQVLGLATELDAYRLPDYEGHAMHVLSGRMYAVKVRLHVALVGNQLIAATTPETLREVIDASLQPPQEKSTEAHALLRLNRRALNRLYDDAQMYWAEKSRQACHKNAIAIYTLCKLYDVPVDEVGAISESKYGVTWYCPDEGEYTFDRSRDEVTCSVHGNRRHARQEPRLDQKSSFSQFIDTLSEITATLRFEDEALIATVEIVREGE